jgi:primosomal protein N' (replication factor Y)
VQTGFVTEILDSSDYTGSLADIEDVVSEVAVLTPELLALAREVASRHAGGVSDVLRLAIPPRGVRAEKAWKERPRANREFGGPIQTSGVYETDGTSQMLTPGAKTWWQLLHGVEGSNLIAYREVVAAVSAVLAKGMSVVISAPDWRDVALLHELLIEAVGGEFVSRFDADQTPGERYACYLRGLEPDPVVVIGARHAIYAPVSQLGLIIVLNDSDDLHREPLAPYPHTRDVALIRAEQSGAALVLASVSPSLATLRLVDMGFLAVLRPRVDHRPRVIPTALTAVEATSAQQARLPSMAYKAVSEAVKDGPVLVQVFRSGFSPGVACAHCRERARCRECQGPLRAHRQGDRVRCAWCATPADAWSCSLCGEKQWVPIGQAIGRTANELGKAFPGVAVIRADGEHRKLRVSAKPALVVSTRGAEPLAEGGYRAALLLDGEGMLQRPALSALTETLDSWEHALTLLAPGAQAFLTDVEGPIANAMAAANIEGLLRRELAERAQVHLPPSVRLVVVEGAGAHAAGVVGNMRQRFPALETIGPHSLPSGAHRYLLKVPYSDAPALAGELRAEVIRSAVSKAKGAIRLRVSFDGVSALDELATRAE